MSVSGLLSLLGGLALFLYGMQMMSSGLEAAAGSKMKLILERLTANRFLGVLVGAGITAVIHCSGRGRPCPSLRFHRRGHGGLCQDA